MIVTEEEAKTKWCPFARYAMRDESGLITKWLTAINRWFSAHEKQLNPEPARCIGCECMGWVWAKQAEKTGTCGYVTNVTVPVQIVAQQERRAAPNSKIVLPRV